MYHPPYLFQGNLPRIATPPPTFTPYGSTFEVGYAFHSPAAITAVVLHNAGGVTHNYAIGESHRHPGLTWLQLPLLLLVIDMTVDRPLCNHNA